MGYGSHYFFMEYNLLSLQQCFYEKKSEAGVFILLVALQINFKEKVELGLQMREAPRAIQLIALPHSFNVGVSLRVDHEAPVDVLLDGVEPPELPGHDDQDGGDVDQHQALKIRTEMTYDTMIVYNLYKVTLTSTNTKPTLVPSSSP